MKGKRLTLITLSFLVLATLLVAGPARAQDEQLSLRLRRDFGYSSGAGDIEGRFSLHASGPDDLVSVSFFMDGEEMGTDTEAPFRRQFETGDYSLGIHTMTASGETSDGQVLQSASISRNFVEPGEGLQAALRIAMYVGIGLLVVFIVVSLILAITTRGRPALPLGAPRQYGHYGGTVCPNCQRPYSMHIYGLNLLSRRFDRCPHCGKWRLVRRHSGPELESAERAELGQGADVPDAPTLSEEDKFRRNLEDSRFDDV